MVTERMPREQRPEVIERMIDHTQHAPYQTPDDIWHVLALARGGATWGGVPILKNQFDLRRYFDIVDQRDPALIVETGVQYGGSSLFFMDALASFPRHDRRECDSGVYIGVDLNFDLVPPIVMDAPWPHAWVRGDCLDPRVAQGVADLAGEHAPYGSRLIVLDSVHTLGHVREELKLYAPLCRQGDILVVEDTDHNGHPALSGYGPCAWEAVEEFLAGGAPFRRFEDIEKQYGPFTCAPGGWLERV